MRTLLKNGTVVNVFTGELEKANVLIGDEKIIGVGDYTDCDADVVADVSGKYICPGFIDGHIHIESTMLMPEEFARACIPHGTTSVVADPHEIANVCGAAGVNYMLEASEDIPMTVYVMLPSCVPATRFDECGGALDAQSLRPLYAHPRVLGLGEMMNYPGVLAEDEAVLRKIEDAHALGRIVNGHAPCLSGRELDKYIAAGINDDHECSTAEEAMERIRKGQWVMIRQGTAARNLQALLPLFEEPWKNRCLLVTDDRHPADLLGEGHIDSIIRAAAAAGKSPVTGIQMATLHAAQCFGLQGVGALAPGYAADLLVLDSLEDVRVRDVYRAGLRIVENGRLADLFRSGVRSDAWKAVHNSFYMARLCPEDFHIAAAGESCRAIGVVPGELITNEEIVPLDLSRNNGVDIERDLLKLAVVERHLHTGHVGLGFIRGIGMKRGAIASSVSHDSHNLIIIGTNEEDMAAAGNRIRSMGGGCVVVADGDILAEMALPIAGLMSEKSAAEVAAEHEAVRSAVHALGVNGKIEPFMNMAFVSLPVIPHLKMSTLGLVDVDRQELVPLFVK